MHIEAGFATQTLLGFLLVLARVGGVVALTPFPGFRNAPVIARAILTVAITLALFPVWPKITGMPPIGRLLAWAGAECGFGLTIGLAVSFLLEAAQLAFQILSLQAGYAYASTIDPTSQADAGVLQVFAFLLSGMLFFAFGLDREVLRILAASFERFPAGSYVLTMSSADAIVRLGSGLFTVALRLAMPVVALLLLIDIALALLGRMQQQLQLITLAFPLKMLGALALLAAMTPLIPKVFDGYARHVLAALWRGM